MTALPTWRLYGRIAQRFATLPRAVQVLSQQVLPCRPCSFCCSLGCRRVQATPPSLQSKLQHWGTGDRPTPPAAGPCRQAQAIPSYLLALAVGNLESRRLGPISHVWSEPEMVEAGAYEFAGGVVGLPGHAHGAAASALPADLRAWRGRLCSRRAGSAWAPAAVGGPGNADSWAARCADEGGPMLLASQHALAPPGGSLKDVFCRGLALLPAPANAAFAAHVPFNPPTPPPPHTRPPPHPHTHLRATETQSFLDAAASLAGPYQWGIYDVLLLPPSFPYGGMENPCLT